MENVLNFYSLITKQVCAGGLRCLWNSRTYKCKFASEKESLKTFLLYILGFCVLASLSRRVFHSSCGRCVKRGLVLGLSAPDKHSGVCVCCVCEFTSAPLFYTPLNPVVHWQKFPSLVRRCLLSLFIFYTLAVGDSCKNINLLFRYERMR